MPAPAQPSPPSRRTVPDLLGTVPLFQGLGDAERATLAAQCRRRRCDSSEVLFREGDPGNSLYVVVEGHVHIERTDSEGGVVHIARRGPGEHFGELALLDALPRSADAVADGPCELLVLARPDLRRFCENHPATAWTMLQGLATRLRQATDRIHGDGTRDVLGRLAAVLLEAAAESNLHSDDGHPVIEGTNDTRLAQRIGSTRETINRRLTSLRRLGILRRDGRQLVILDTDRLAKLRDQR